MCTTRAYVKHADNTMLTALERFVRKWIIWSSEQSTTTVWQIKPLFLNKKKNVASLSIKSASVFLFCNLLVLISWIRMILSNVLGAVSCMFVYRWINLCRVLLFWVNLRLSSRCLLFFIAAGYNWLYSSPSSFSLLGPWRIQGSEWVSQSMNIFERQLMFYTLKLTNV